MEKKGHIGFCKLTIRKMKKGKSLQLQTQVITLSILQKSAYFSVSKIAL